MVANGHKVIHFYLLFLWLLLPMADAAEVLRSTGDFSAPAQTMVIRDGRMDARVNGAALRVVMETLAAQTGLTVSVAPSLLEDPVYVNFHGLSLEEGLRKIAAPYSYALVFSSERDHQSRHPVTAVRLYPKGRAEGGPYKALGNGTTGNEDKRVPSLETPDDWEARLQIHDQITLSHAARKTQERAERPRTYDGLPATSIIQSSVKRLRTMAKPQRRMDKWPATQRIFSAWRLFHGHGEKADFQRYIQRQQRREVIEPSLNSNTAP